MYKNRSILAVVPARGGSKGIKLKNLKKVNNLSLIGHVGKILKNLPIIDKKIVSTDHKDILKEALKYNIEAPFVRPKNISGDRVADIDVLYHALNESEKYFKVKFNYIVMLQPTSPLRDFSIINKMIIKAINHNYDSLWSISEIDNKFHPYKQLKINKNNLNYFNHNEAKKIIARQQLDKTYIRNGICYIFSRKLIKQKKIINKNSGYELIKHKYINIDSINDLDLANKLLKKFINK